jgi:hypothetical protein
VKIRVNPTKSGQIKPISLLFRCDRSFQEWYSETGFDEHRLCPATTVTMKLPLISCFVLASLLSPLVAQDILSKRVEFPKGANSVTLKGKITGRESLDYQVMAKVGQSMTVTLESATPSQNFNVLPSGGGAALHIGSRDGTTFTDKLPANGDYTIRVYLMGNARDTGATVAHTLKISLDDQAAAGTTDFDKTLSLQGISFRVMTARNDKGEVFLRVAPRGLKKDNATAETVIDGTVTGAEVGDLNADGSPEIYVFTRSAREPHTAALYAWATNRKRSMTPIFLPPLSDDAVNSKGYRRGDEIAVVENVVARRFPIYPEDPAVKEPTGKIRQLQYKLKKGEAGWVLKLDQMVEY